MSAAAIAKALAVAGASGEQIAAAIEAYEAPVREREALKREATRQRNIAYRQRQKSLNNNCHVTSCDRHDASRDVTGPSPLVPPSDGFPKPLPVTPPYNPPILAPTKGARDDSGFAEFWSGWIPVEMPKGDRKAALKRYELARKDADHATIIRRRDEYLAECRAYGNKTKHASTWLNSDWNREYETNLRSGAGKPQNGVHSKRAAESFTSAAEALAAKYRAQADAEAGGSIHSSGQGSISGGVGAGLLDAEGLRKGTERLGIAGGGVLPVAGGVQHGADNSRAESLHAAPPRHPIPGEHSADHRPDIGADGCCSLPGHMHQDTRGIGIRDG